MSPISVLGFGVIGSFFIFYWWIVFPDFQKEIWQWKGLSKTNPVLCWAVRIYTSASIICLVYGASQL